MLCLSLKMKHEETSKLPRRGKTGGGESSSCHCMRLFDTVICPGGEVAFQSWTHLNLVGHEILDQQLCSATWKISMIQDTCASLILSLGIFYNFIKDTYTLYPLIRTITVGKG